MTETWQRTELVPYGEGERGRGEGKGKGRGKGRALRFSPLLQAGRAVCTTQQDAHSTDSGTGPEANGSAGRGRQLGGQEEK